MDEAERKRRLALEAVGPFATNELADVRWLLCGRGRPISAGISPYTLVVDEGRAQVFYQDLERPRILAEERWEELGYEPVAYAWHEAPPIASTDPDLGALRRTLGPEELDRYRRAANEVAAAFTAAIDDLSPKRSELEAVGALAGRLQASGFTTPVLLAGGEARSPVHRHPLPTDAPLGRFVLMAVTAEREGLHTSMTRIICFGEPPEELRDRVNAAAAVDAAVLDAAAPGRTLGELFDVIVAAYTERGSPEEWRLHHQGGLAGYRGREAFAVPGSEVVLPVGCAVAFNPSFTGGGKSEDTALVTHAGVEIITATPDLPLLPNGRPSIVVL